MKKSVKTLVTFPEAHMRLSFRSFFTALFILLWVASGIGVAQTTKPYTDPFNKDMTGTQTTSTSTNAAGNTVERTITDTSGPAGGKYEVRKETREVEKDKDGNVIRESSSENVTTYEKKDGKKISVKDSKYEKTSNAIGDSKQVWDETTVHSQSGWVEEHHREITRDANMKVTGEESYTDRQPGQKPVTRKYRRTDDGHWEPISMSSPKLTSITAASGNGASNEVAYLPDVAGPGSTIMATFTHPDQTGPSGNAVIAFEDNKGHRSFFKAVANARHHLLFKVAEGAVAVLLFKDFTGDKKPDDAAVRCAISRTGIVSDTEPVANAPQQGVAITRGVTAYERGGASNGLVSLQTRGNDPATSHLLIDGSPNESQTVASSDMNVKSVLNANVDLGRHNFAIESNGQRSNSIPTDIVSLRADPVAGGETGTVSTLTVHVDGLPPGDSGTMYFTISGSARLEDGSENAQVPVRNGIAQVRIRGVHSGPGLVKYKLRAQIAG